MLSYVVFLFVELRMYPAAMTMMESIRTAGSKHQEYPNGEG